MKQLLFLVLLPISLIHAQFANVNCTLDMDLLKQTEQQGIANLNRVVEQFFLNSMWDQDASDLEMAMEIQIVFLTTVDIENKLHYQAQIFFTNKLDQMYLLRNAVFAYTPGQTIKLNDTQDPLGMLLTFYGWLFIASELDTYSLLAGSAIFQKMITLGIQGENARYLAGGWTERLRLAERLFTNHDGRRARAYFYQALGSAIGEEPDLVLAKEAMENFYNAIEKVFLREGQERYTGLFLTGHAEEIAELMITLGMKEELAAMAAYNPEAKRFYEGMLEK